MQRAVAGTQVTALGPGTFGEPGAPPVRASCFRSSVGTCEGNKGSPVSADRFCPHTFSLLCSPFTLRPVHCPVLHWIPSCVVFYALHSGHQFLFHNNHSCHLLTEYDSYSGPDRGERFTGRLEDHNAKNTENKESQTAIPFEKLI